MIRIIEFQMPSFKDQFVTSQKMSKLCLYENYLELEQMFYASEKDGKMGITHDDVYRHYYSIMNKSSIESIAAGNEPVGEEKEYWYIIVYGVGSTLKMYFKIEKEQKAALTMLLSWRFC